MSEFTRRQALAASGALVAARLANGQRVGGEAPARLPPLQELLNAEEFRTVAERKLDPITFAEVGGSERGAFEKITFRPRLMIDSRQMDLSSRLFGDTLFTPILVGPIARLKRYHPEGELAMARGAAAAKATMVVSADSSYPIEQIAEAAKTPLWYQVYLDSEVPAKVPQAMKAGCKALCITATSAFDWKALDRLRQGVTAPVILKGVMSPEEAQKAIAAGLQGIVVSNYSPKPMIGIASPIEMLPSIVDAVGGKIPILIDGSFRRGSDVLKAIALGANAVLLGRPAVWGLSAYGAEGVQAVVELIQSEFARDMAMCGKVNLKAVDRTVITIHKR
jgi:4-hydroxymandelate oxidase